MQSLQIGSDLTSFKVQKKEKKRKETNLYKLHSKVST